MRTLKHLIFILVFLSLFIVACSDSSSNNTVEDEKGDFTTVTVAQPVDIESLNPYSHSDSPSYGLWRHVIEPLVYFDFDKKEYYGVLAEKWEIKDDVDWVFYLKQDITFHNDSELIADDVVHSFNRIMDDPESRQGSFLSKVSHVEAVDTYTVKVTLEEPSSSFLKELTFLHITNKALYDELGQEEADSHPIGTGPYKFKEWKRDERYVVEKYDNYWNGEPGVDEIVFRPMSEDSARIAALESGEVDIIPIPLQDIDRLEDNPDIIVKDTKSLREMMFILNPAIEPLDDVRVRKAINYAIDRETIAENVLDGRVDLLDGPVADDVVGYDPTLETYSYDPNKARELLAEAGYKDGFDLDLYSPSGRYPQDVNVSEAVISQLEEVGIRAKLNTPEWGIFVEEYSEGQYGMYYIGLGPVFDADYLMRLYFRSGVTDRTLYSNPKFDEMLDKAETKVDPIEREALLQEAGEILYDDAAAVFMYTNRDYYATSNKIDDWTARPDEYILVGVPGE